MRVLTKTPHDAYDVGAVYDCEQEQADRLLAAGYVLPADQFTHRYAMVADADGGAEPRHLFDAVAPKSKSHKAPKPTQETTPAVVTNVAASPKVR